MLSYSYIFKSVLYNIYHISSYIVVYTLYKYFPIVFLNQSWSHTINQNISCPVLSSSNGGNIFSFIVIIFISIYIMMIFLILLSAEIEDAIILHSSFFSSSFKSII